MTEIEQQNTFLEEGEVFNGLLMETEHGVYIDTHTSSTASLFLLIH